ncbi:SDR family oxidoreductase [Xanthobacter tagetidis]|uniref:SDR family oxidoreductase n=1 Tax=Xanthobacter tagetidis TaxID=60216 RepID=A0A3L7AGI5_9HYPH|nr:SDR family oxidoreductase [Xanthobacter tagetidis]MBB6306314.1 3-oxoacyl-[acyl-carrier protein] reductase [Xanthobacter tagetidis]RLP79583.1 SDR family oxidoreductase [Xanthobacter tagetidis]
MNFGLEARTALVLGASGGLGGAIAAALGREGARVALAGRNVAALDRAAATVEAGGGTALVMPFDLADLGAIEEAVGKVETALGPVDILVNNTGGPPPTTAAGQPIELWEKNFRAMVLSVIAITDRILPGMRARQWGRIITVTSSGTIAPIPNLAMSNTLRVALTGWSKTLAREVAQDGITVNTLVPGRIATERVAFLDEAAAKREGIDVDEVRVRARATIPAGRYGRPEEFGDAACFLASNQASFITGSMIRVDGGQIPNL